MVTGKVFIAHTSHTCADKNGGGKGAVENRREIRQKMTVFQRASAVHIHYVH